MITKATSPVTLPPLPAAIPSEQTPTAVPSRPKSKELPNVRMSGALQGVPTHPLAADAKPSHKWNAHCSYAVGLGFVAPILADVILLGMTRTIRIIASDQRASMPWDGL